MKTTQQHFFNPGKHLPAFSLLLAGFMTIAIFTSYTPKDRPLQLPSGLLVGNELPQTIKSVRLDKPFEFAGETLPMTNFDVRERLEKEILRTAYYHSSTLLNLKRTTRHFPVIERILRQHGMPTDLKFLAVAESDLTNATSPAGAKGYWQFLKGTAREYGLEVNEEVDERLDLEKSTEAACRMFKNYFQRFGSWTMAAAAYNMGAAGLTSDATAQRSTNYYDLNLNEETSRYIFRIVAMKEILANPEAYGFFLDRDEYYPPLDNFTTVEVSTAIESLGDFAQSHGISYRMLKLYNPWLVSNKLVNKDRKTYQVKIAPKKF
jgi:hypothetical protein